MSQSSTSDWEAGTVLKIFTPTNDIACAGVTQAGNPCGWRLEGGDKADARELLEEMSEKSPIEALDDFPELASLVLCRKNHQNQADRVISRWKKAIKIHISASDRATDLPGQYIRPVPGVQRTPIGNNATGVSNSPETYDDVVADISRLCISPAQLRTIVEGHISERRQKLVTDVSARSTPSHSTPSLVRSEASAEPSRSKMSKLKFFKG
jgi:hypothetical protein